MFVSIEISTGRFIEMQDPGALEIPEIDLPLVETGRSAARMAQLLADRDAAIAAAMLANAVAAGFDVAGVEIRVMEADEYVALRAAQPAPEKSAAEQLAASDAAMARVAEDLVVSLLTGAPLPAAALKIVNARRALRGQPPLSA